MRKPTRTTKRQRGWDPLGFLGSAPDLPSFGTGVVAEILGIPGWRLQKFLAGPRYQLSPSGQLGRGRGSRRVFYREDVYRIAIASYLVRDGFSPKFVSSVLQKTQDDYFREDYDEQGEPVPPVGGIAFRRTNQAPRLQFLPSRQLAKKKTESDVYYVLDLDWIRKEIDRRIAAFEKRQSEG